MTGRSRVLVVVPAWNEQGSVAAVVGDLRRQDPALDVLVVDDGSTDETAAAAAAAGALVCRLPFNLGVGGAMRAGYRYARREDYDVVVQVDADGQHDVSYLPQLVARLASADVVVGARFAGVGEYDARGPRRWAMRLLSSVLSRLAREELTDVTSGFRAVNRRGIELFATHYPAEYLGDTVESLVIAVRTGCRVTQVPVRMRVRSAGRASQSTTRAGLYLVRALVALGLALVRRWPLGLAAPAPEPL
ncbi:MAG: glycosyltransferase family 2 protein [Nocardioidaceae bacterium]